MSCSSLWIAPHLHVLIADSDPDYGGGLRLHLKKLGFRTVIQTLTPRETLSRLHDDPYDIIMVEISQPYQLVWDALEDAGPGSALIVGMSLDRSGHDWVAAIHQGANAILMKAFYTHLLKPVLTHMLASPAAYRGRIVQFPQPASLDVLNIMPTRRSDSRDSRDR